MINNVVSDVPIIAPNFSQSRFLWGVFAFANDRKLSTGSFWNISKSLRIALQLKWSPHKHKRWDRPSSVDDLLLYLFPWKCSTLLQLILLTNPSNWCHANDDVEFCCQYIRAQFRRNENCFSLFKDLERHHFFVWLLLKDEGMSVFMWYIYTRIQPSRIASVQTAFDYFNMNQYEYQASRPQFHIFCHYCLIHCIFWICVTHSQRFWSFCTIFPTPTSLFWTQFIWVGAHKYTHFGIMMKKKHLIQYTAIVLTT